ncbi:citrulline utilization hydrolase CtlX [Francisella tularensis]|uniref:Amidinotransferase n=4 Tax=Francisella tularensis TaxID=263 RepID=Q5NES8_FRATT|nr:arginine deiminase-related protein [Francisella tularensis]ADA79183.1 hypothetical protein NE061598_08605 [Francisella tularensis subsp. tularensis NE061598]AFB79555.1 hypothetical protein FTU_1551 [Francisella tularensis subsp. tularensis TIGB03]AFB81099.1 hypothetical protein FTV_1466 [Francisella tularensis subsp. tularensis TI0902]AJI69610.1 amidinotransferase family protein [Francisella tularensis subsp. tularensis SCHU S4]AJI70493.1 amidinotransferase family protein [Francisella tular
MNKYIANTVVMVEPKYFCFNQETSVNNAFQNQLDISNDELQNRVIHEFENMVAKIRANGIEVIVLESKPNTPDAVFPNNWFSTHLIDNQPYVFIYPMYTQNRRNEVQVDKLLEQLNKLTTTNYKVIDLRGDYSKALEGTGVFIFDHEFKTAYMSLSPRADAQLAQQVCDKIGYKLVTFTSYDKKGPIYHTNVMLSIGEYLAIVCLESIKSAIERELVIKTLQQSNKQIIDISLEQMYQMCGNVLEVKNKADKSFLILSQTAYNGFSQSQLALISKYATPIACDITNIEVVGGGSARCMLAEVFL